MMKTLPSIAGIRPLGGFRPAIEFSDKRAGEWDFSYLAIQHTPMTEAFKDPEFFGRVFLEMGALTWPNGYDCCPDSLYKDMVAAGALRS